MKIKNYRFILSTGSEFPGVFFADRKGKEDQIERFCNKAYANHWGKPHSLSDLTCGLVDRETVIEVFHVTKNSVRRFLKEEPDLSIWGEILTNQDGSYVVRRITTGELFLIGARATRLIYDGVHNNIRPKALKHIWS